MSTYTFLKSLGWQMFVTGYKHNREKSNKCKYRNQITFN